ncbi:MAG TPA: alpha-L-rhamnosidase C-terminal domain-containing protein, partial [Flavisolibacter sp.]|nr:alpha-L-rhamnosidase C-terminal domain-containing protein [Flavisolibacter sp.]
PATKQYATGSQTANAMAVYMNLVPSEDREAVVENIVRDIRNRNNSLTAGDIGYRYLLRVLHEAGRDDVIYDMNSRTDVPGYGYQLAKGATALTESWAALPTASNNHFMLGHLMEWFYNSLGGINQTEGSIGYKEILINPKVVGDVTFAKTFYQSPYGLIRSDWKKENRKFTLAVEVPVNTTVIIELPGSENIHESGKPLEERNDVKLVSIDNGNAKIKIGSGHYLFTVDLKSINTEVQAN